MPFWMGPPKSPLRSAPSRTIHHIDGFSRTTSPLAQLAAVIIRRLKGRRTEMVPRQRSARCISVMRTAVSDSASHCVVMDWAELTMECLTMARGKFDHRIWRWNKSETRQETLTQVCLSEFIYWWTHVYVYKDPKFAYRESSLVVTSPDVGHYRISLTLFLLISKSLIFLFTFCAKVQKHIWIRAINVNVRNLPLNHKKRVPKGPLTLTPF